MSLENIVQELHDRLSEEKLQARIVSGTHLQELRDDLERKYVQGLFDRRFYDEWIQELVLGPLKKTGSAQSLIIVAVPQPQYRVVFNRRGKSHAFIIPPTYFHHRDEPVRSTFQQILGRHGYRLSAASPPKKLLAARSGLGRYGRNNLCYVEGLGSFHRLLAFSSDMPCSQDSWYDIHMMDECRECNVCRRACPTGAISDERFLLHAERCITFHNESDRDFPTWLRPEWHNALVGCMLCQKVCPVNKPVVDWIEDSCEFSEKETTQIIDQVSTEQFSAGTLEKLKNMHFEVSISTLGRNLKALMVQKGILNDRSSAHL